MLTRATMLQITQLAIHFCRKTKKSARRKEKNIYIFVWEKVLLSKRCMHGIFFYIFY